VVARHYDDPIVVNPARLAEVGDEAARRTKSPRKRMVDDIPGNDQVIWLQLTNPGEQLVEETAA